VSQKGTPQAEAMWSSEKIKPIYFAIVKLRWYEGIRQALSHSENFVK